MKHFVAFANPSRLLNIAIYFWIIYWGLLLFCLFILPFTGSFFLTSFEVNFQDFKSNAYFYAIGIISALFFLHFSLLRRKIAAWYISIIFYFIDLMIVLLSIQTIVVLPKFIFDYTSKLFIDYDILSLFITNPGNAIFILLFTLNLIMSSFSGIMAIATFILLIIGRTQFTHRFKETV